MQYGVLLFGNLDNGLILFVGTQSDFIFIFFLNSCSKYRYLTKLVKTAAVQVFVPSVKVKGLCSRDSQMETLRKLDLVLRMRPLDIQQGITLFCFSSLCLSVIFCNLIYKLL